MHSQIMHEIWKRYLGLKASGLDVNIYSAVSESYPIISNWYLTHLTNIFELVTSSSKP